jgi:hypothetical protein
MLCERCKKREANTHLTIVLDDKGETEHHCCEVCYPEVEAERNRTYNTQTPTPLRSDVERITAKEFVEIQERGTRNSVDMPAWKQLLEKLAPLRDVKERLTFEAIALVWDCLQAGTQPPSPALMLVSLYLPKDSQRVAEHTDWLEKMIFKAFELRKALPYDPGRHGPFTLTLMTLCTPLSIRDPNRFERILASLKAKGADPTSDIRWDIIASIEKSAHERRNLPPPPQNGTNL